MLVATLFFAVMAVLVKKAAAKYNVGEILFYRSLVSVALLGAYCAVTKGQFRSNNPWSQATQALVGSLGVGLYFFSMTKLPLATAVTLNYTSSIWLALLLAIIAWWQGSTGVRPASLFAVFVGFLGVALTLKPTLAENQLMFALSGLASGLLAAGGYLLSAQLVKRGEPMYRVLLYLSLGTSLLGAFLATAMGWHTLAWNDVPLLLGIGVFGIAGQLLLTQAYSGGNPVVSASLQYVGIAYSLVFGVVLFGDKLTVSGLLGIAVIVLSAIACVRLGQKR